MVVNYYVLLQGKAKWDAWNGKKGMSQEEAKQKYIEYAKQMLEKHGARAE
jgi:diazepam-binding inhibitor (GABA receptor modulating acyl-CoA-binding protein)